MPGPWGPGDPRRRVPRCQGPGAGGRGPAGRGDGEARRGRGGGKGGWRVGAGGTSGASSHDLTISPGRQLASSLRVDLAGDRPPGDAEQDADGDEKHQERGPTVADEGQGDAGER